ncbi:GTPase IMAP member 7 [Balamuthia mandrillaris]
MNDTRSGTTGRAKKKVLLVGLTGSGKSATANWVLGSQEFVESEGAHSETKLTISKAGTFDGAFDVEVIDTPGYLDTEGEDVAHFTAMVEKVKGMEEIDMVALVLNFWNPRFDSNVQKMLRVFFTMFKHGNMWDNFAIIFTRAYREQVTAAAKESARREYCGAVRRFVEGLGARMACNPFCCFIDAHPEEGGGGSDASTRNERTALAGFLASLSPMSTSQMQDPGEYMNLEEETKMVITEKGSTPVFEQYPIVEKVPVLGNSSGFKIGFGGFSIEFGGGSKVVGWKEVNCGSASRLAGHNISEKGVIMKREKRTWYDGKTVSYSPWEIVESFAEEKKESFSLYTRRCL